MINREIVVESERGGFILIVLEHVNKFIKIIEERRNTGQNIFFYEFLSNSNQHKSTFENKISIIINFIFDIFIKLLANKTIKIAGSKICR